MHFGPVCLHPHVSGLKTYNPNTWQRLRDDLCKALNTLKLSPIDFSGSWRHLAFYRIHPLISAKFLDCTFSIQHLQNQALNYFMKSLVTNMCMVSGKPSLAKETCICPSLQSLSAVTSPVSFAESGSQEPSCNGGFYEQTLSSVKWTEITALFHIGDQTTLRHYWARSALKKW